MFLADRHRERLLGYTFRVVPVAVVLTSAALCGRALKLPAPARNPGAMGRTNPEWRGAAPAGDVDWTILRSSDGAPPAGSGSLARVFRLAGTFFAYGEGARDHRKAVLDNLKNGKQTIVQERAIVDGVTVVKIYQNRVVLRGAAGEEDLWLGFSQGAAQSVASGDDAHKPRPAPGRNGPETRFGGKQVGASSWVFRRAPLLKYYNELRQEPSRLYAVFDSMKPIYGEGNQIFGYQLQVEGEEEFWAAAGLQNGDIVRKVNSVMMSNRRRAEHFISQFIKNEANIFVLDLERGGEPVRQSYSMR